VPLQLTGKMLRLSLGTLIEKYFHAEKELIHPDAGVGITDLKWGRHDGCKRPNKSDRYDRIDR
jgi:hypothetical protein